MMKSRFVFVLLSVILFGCQSGNQKSEPGSLRVIDISKNYSKKVIHLQNAADIEYIPLETTDDVLLGQMCILSYVSDKYMVIWEIGRCDIFVFDRNGKIITHFNHKGNGDKEYLGITNVIFDEKNNEIFVLSMPTHSILVYSISGEYKRILRYITDLNIASAYNFDDETLLVYNDYRPYYESTCERPYMFMSKKDGSIVSALDIRMPIRYSNRIVQEIDLGGDQKGFTPLVLSTPNNRYFGQDFVIADISSDTIYILKPNKELSPLLVRTPSVHISEPRSVWTSLLTTDEFIVLHMVTLDFTAAEKGRPIPSVTLMYDFKTEEICEVSFVDIDYNMRKWQSLGVFSPDISKNMYAELISVPKLKDAYEKNLLKGKLGELIERLDENDNPIVRIVNFK